MEPRPTTLAGGCLIAICLIVGLAWGAYAHQPSIGFLAGLGAGLALSLLLWLFDLMRRRNR
jgi:Na+-transporting NADH:ubiquinone oxidoreductase subunit NqrD